MSGNPEDIAGEKIQKVLIAGANTGEQVRSTNGGLDVNIQDQTTPSVEHFLYQEQNDISFIGNLTKGQNIFALNPGHNIVNDSFTNPNDRDYINIHYVDADLPGVLGARFNQFAVVTISGNNISVTPPIPYDLDISKIETAKRVRVNMAVAGTHTTPVKFETRPPNGLRWDLTRMILDMILTSGADDGKFGNLPALINGIYFGFEGDNFTEYQLTVIDNGGFRASAFDVLYTSRSGGGGDYGQAVRKTSAGQDKLGVTIRLDGVTNDKFVKYVQDSLLLLNRYRVKIMGHVVE